MFKKDGQFAGSAVSADAALLAKRNIPIPPPRPVDDMAPGDPQTFKNVFRTFVSVMDSYRKFIALTLSFAPVISSLLSTHRILSFAKTKGRERLDISNDNVTIYEFDVSCYREFMVNYDEVTAVREGARYLPGVMIIGLVSAYDTFLSNLLRVIIHKHSDIVLTSEKTIRFSELAGFSSIEEARNSLIDREIEAVIRLSHHEQFKWMESRFSIKLREKLPVWPRFVELCERRNLLTHTGGIVSADYIENCKAHKCNMSGIEIGTKLSVDAKYFSEGVRIIYEVGTKLCHVFWRKFAKEERQEADTRLNELGFDLILGREYRLAEDLLSFGVNILKMHASDVLRRTMVVNLANAVRLQNREDEAKEILNKEDWSACDNGFQICVAAVRGDIDEVVRVMRIRGRGEPGKVPLIETYRTWPVYRGMRTEEQFMTAFQEIFGEPVITPRAVEVSLPPDSASVSIEEPITRH
jgi:hypothetical protein